MGNLNYLTPKDLLGADDLKEYETAPYPFNLGVLYSAVKEKIKTDPSYEVWVPLVYHKLASHVRNRALPMTVRPYKIFISNRGAVRSERSGKSAILNNLVSTNGYPITSLALGNGENLHVVLHRAIACCFLPVPKEIGVGKRVHDLEVNHIDGVKLNIGFTNLEWCTRLGNLEHAFSLDLMNVENRTGLSNSKTKPIKVTVLKGIHKGFQFVLCGVKEVVSLGFDQPNVSRCCNNLAKTHKGCKWEFANEEDLNLLPLGLPEEVKASLQR